MELMLLVLNIDFRQNYSLMLFSLTFEYCFDINIKYMHVGMNDCFAAAVLSITQKRADWATQKWH